MLAYTKIKMEYNIIPIWLSDTFGIILPDPLIEINPNIDYTFVPGNIIVHQLHRTGKFNKNTDIITFVIPGLRGLYWDNREQLSIEEQLLLDLTMDEDMVKFKERSDDVYQINGELSEFDVLYIPVNNFVEIFNAKNPIQLVLQGTNILIQLDYEPHDFWDDDEQKIIDII